ncbi:2-dehydro-3-deoxygalactonokinase [Roseateles sp. NT4]|uniref:2-dehydro-3-deoxygalactonokinase n=1 Tax=Roseateles sp. NT4 TaxID=3453715 RepID=UPI003EEF1E3E
MTNTNAKLIALDWGSTRLRAFLLGTDGTVLETRQSEQGASTLSGESAFAQAFAAITTGWTALPALACGMVGSQHGWREAPYAPCPADAAALARAALQVKDKLWILPGLMRDGAQPDVMRGEETQIVGALALHPELAAQSCLVLPGTHSKWARVGQGRVTGFATHMTGELYALLRQHSVLSRLMPADGSAPPSPQAFLAGVDAAREDGALSHQLFAVRTLGLFKRLPPADLPDYLSGLLIGHEIAHELKAGAPECLALIGDPALCERYALALGRFGVHAPLQLDNTAPAGLWQLAQTMGLD